MAWVIPTGYGSIPAQRLYPHWYGYDGSTGMGTLHPGGSDYMGDFGIDPPGDWVTVRLSSQLTLSADCGGI